MGTDTGLYKFVLLLHILSIVVGIGATMLNGVYATKAKKLGGPGAGAVMKVNFDVTLIAEKVIYSIPVWGILLVILSDKVYEFSQTWIWLSLVLYVVAMGIAHAVMIPSGRRMQEVGAKLGSGQGGPTDVAEAQALEKKLMTGGMTLNLIVVALIALMIWKPGF
jgi:uncharacterized membrane protein